MNSPGRGSAGSGRRARSVAVVGAGVSGLVAAYRLRQALGADAVITVFDSAGRTGGKLHTGTLAGIDVDLGAEAFIARRPEVPALVGELGLSAQLVYPSDVRPLVYAGAELHPLPARTLMGIPASADDLAGLVDAATLSQIRHEPGIPLSWDPGSDCDVDALVSARFGGQAVRRSVDPLLGGVYSGLSSSIGVRAALPTLAAALDAGAPNLSGAVARALPPTAGGPVFGALRAGYRTLLDALEQHSGAEIRLGTPVCRIQQTDGRWSIEAGGPAVTVDAVVLAVPAPQLAELLSTPAPAGASAAREIEVASSVVVALAYPRNVALPHHSGVLVATGEPLRAKAFTLSSRKWPHLAARDVSVVRASFGRFGDSGVVDLPDDELIAMAATDLTQALGVAADPVDAVVQRWPGGLPQYGPGHLDKIARIEAAVANLDGLEIAGALLYGVGVPACIASGTAAARAIAAQLAR